MANLGCSESIVIARSPEALYALVSDVTRMGQWSPVCKACWWDEGAGPQVGAWFTGRNEKPGRIWETRSEVVVAEPVRGAGADRQPLAGRAQWDPRDARRDQAGGRI
jgi:Polyketide cyclase / dehydrase and lipid transport